MSVEQFMGGNMLLSWDLTPDHSNGVAYLSQISGHRQRQSEIRQALASNHHTDSLCPVRLPGGC